MGHGLQLLRDMWDLQNGGRPVFPALGGRFFTSEQPEKFTVVCTILGISGDSAPFPGDSCHLSVPPSTCSEERGRHAPRCLSTPAPAAHQTPAWSPHVSTTDQRSQPVTHQRGRVFTPTSLSALLLQWPTAARPATLNQEIDPLAV